MSDFDVAPPPLPEGATTDVEPMAPVEVEVEPAPLVPANPNDGYAFAAIVCAILGFVIPVLPAAAALMLVRATEIAEQPLSPGAARLASAAQTLAYVSLTLMSVLCAALLLGILGRTLS